MDLPRYVNANLHIALPKTSKMQKQELLQIIQAKFCTKCPKHVSVTGSKFVAEP